MQKVVYECDECKKVIGDVSHITLVVQTNHPGTGVAMPPTVENTHWTRKKMPESFVHFHFGCIEKYFRGLEKKYNDATKKK